ncbi:MAG: hypothetical protein JEZ06_12150 [Anaerolineaceae bacterium]|nr:hypothetical protein [Anaerolineaceae bacterium]
MDRIIPRSTKELSCAGSRNKNKTPRAAIGNIRTLAQQWRKEKYGKARIPQTDLHRGLNP